MAAISAQDHWTQKGEVRLFLFEKHAAQTPGDKPAGTPGHKPAVLFVHGSSMASQPTFDLKVPGRAHSSAMDYMTVYHILHAFFTQPEPIYTASY